MAGTSAGRLPPQRQFGIDYGQQLLGSAVVGFVTMGDTTFAGASAWAVRARHDFGRRLWELSGISGLRDLPLALSAHAGLFRTGGGKLGGLGTTGGRNYSEIGFGIGNSTPFLTPFNLGVAFTWQASRFPPHGFRMTITNGF